MYCKECITCGDTSYSSSTVGQWRCCGCGEDLSTVVAELASNKKEHKKREKKSA